MFAERPALAPYIVEAVRSTIRKLEPCVYEASREAAHGGSRRVLALWLLHAPAAGLPATHRPPSSRQSERPSALRLLLQLLAAR